MAKKIELEIDGETKEFYQPARIKGSALRVGLKVAKRFDEAEGGIPDEDTLDELFQYIAEYGYNNQFTASELEDGLDARDVLEVASEQLSSILKRDDESTGKSTKAKTA